MARCPRSADRRSWRRGGIRVMLGIAASLLRMVAEYTADDPGATECGSRLTALRSDALDAAEADGVTSADFGAALALSTEDPDREPRVRKAAVDAAASSARLGDVGIRLLPEVRLLAEIGNPHLAADLAVAAEALGAGLAGAVINLRANLQIARRHDAAASDLADLGAQASRLAEAARAARQIAEEASSRFED
ncbi:hypothetical protein D7252_04705 [Microbacterium sp. CGR2]|nr:hypothetical protein D7252_04705 [Microbacterium sp. CGR2]